MVIVGYTTLHDLASWELQFVPDDERNREFGSAMRRQQFLCGRFLLRRMLQDWTGLPAASHQLMTARDGKPTCVAGPAISITHAGDRVVCSIAESGAIGVDLELADNRRDHAKIANKYFSAEESAWLDTQPQDRFFMLWVLKEAYVKALGRSIFGGINRLHCRVQPPDIEVMEMNDPMRQLCLYETDDGFLALATTTASLADVSVRRWAPSAGELVESDDIRLLATSRDLTVRRAVQEQMRNIPTTAEG